MKLRRHYPSDAAIRAAGNCPTCHATGQVPLGAPMDGRLIACPDCEGTGRG